MLRPFVTADEIPAGATIVDVRWTTSGSDRAAYLAGHLPGAVFVDLDEVLAGAPGPVVGRHPLPSPEVLADGLGAAGIAEDAVVVAYDDAGSVPAARLVWMLRVLGQDAAVLDGGLAAWSGPLERGDVAVPPVRRRRRPWPPAAIADADEVAVAAAAGQVIDCRSAERYRGEPSPLDPRPGHVPGARSLPYTGSLGPHGRLRPGAELRARFDAVEAGDGTIFYCGSGVSACVNLLAAEHAGVGRGRLYVGSWSGWASDPDRPAATGPDA